MVEVENGLVAITFPTACSVTTQSIGLCYLTTQEYLIFETVLGRFQGLGLTVVKTLYTTES
jgi:hypothetical protein